MGSPALRLVVVALAVAVSTTGTAVAQPARTAGVRPTEQTSRVRAGTSTDLAGGDTSVGRWKVTAQGGHRYRVSWTSPDPLPVTDARPSSRPPQPTRSRLLRSRSSVRTDGP